MERDLHYDGLDIPADIYREMVSHATGDRENEVCGILGGYPRDKKNSKKNLVERIFRGENVDRSPVSYQLDPRQQLRIEKELKKEGMQMLAIYHSHPHGQAYPSPKDVLLAVWDVIYIIIGLPGDEKQQVRAFRILSCEKEPAEKEKKETVREVPVRAV